MHPAISRADAAMRAAAARADADPRRPGFHFRPPAQWMNDPNGTMFHQGYFHLFYQCNPYADAWAQMHWGHARSRDLVRWEHLPAALWPDEAGGEAHCFSGCAAIAGDGQPVILYTSVDHREGSGRPHEQWAALGDAELLTWVKHPRNPLLALPHPGGPALGPDWRDPFIFAHAGRTFLVLGADTVEEAIIPLYEAVDDTLTAWQYRGPFFRAPKTALPFPECPNVAHLGGR